MPNTASKYFVNSYLPLRLQPSPMLLYLRQTLPAFLQLQPDLHHLLFLTLMQMLVSIECARVFFFLHVQKCTTMLLERQPPENLLGHL